MRVSISFRLAPSNTMRLGFTMSAPGFCACANLATDSDDSTTATIRTGNARNDLAPLDDLFIIRVFFLMLQAKSAECSSLLKFILRHKRRLTKHAKGIQGVISGENRIGVNLTPRTDPRGAFIYLAHVHAYHTSVAASTGQMCNAALLPAAAPKSYYLVKGIAPKTSAA